MSYFGIKRHVLTGRTGTIHWLITSFPTELQEKTRGVPLIFPNNSVLGRTRSNFGPQRPAPELTHEYQKKPLSIKFWKDSSWSKNPMLNQSKPMKQILGVHFDFRSVPKQWLDYIMEPCKRMRQCSRRLRPVSACPSQRAIRVRLGLTNLTHVGPKGMAVLPQIFTSYSINNWTDVQDGLVQGVWFFAANWPFGLVPVWNGTVINCFIAPMSCSYMCILYI